MKEDAQLICPISFDDPHGIWQSLYSNISDKLPLRDLSWKNNTTSSYLTIPRLPLKFLPSTSNLFKDTDHPFRWFLAPYVHLFVCNIESIDAYKAIKSQLKQWVEVQGGLKRSYWLIVYAPSQNISADIQVKIYNRLSSDFYVDRSGDRIIIINNQVVTLLKQQQPYNDLLSKIREGIIFSFQNRLVMYDNDIRRLDSFRGTLQLEFRQLFLVKESLALMYQMMQLPNESLIQYEELEALLSFAPLGVLPDPDWPWVLVDNPVNTKTASLNTTPNSQPTDLSSAPNSSTEKLQSPSSFSSHPRELDGWINVCKNGDEVLLYSMNISRTKILKNKLSQLEIYKYIFSRQVYLLCQLNKSEVIAEKGYAFILSARSSIEQLLHDKIISSSDDDVIMKQINLKSKQADLWAVVASVKIIRACLDSSHKTIDDVVETTRRSSNSVNIDSPWNNISVLSFNNLSDLLRYASSKLVNIIPSIKNSRKYCTSACLNLSTYENYIYEDPVIWDSKSRRSGSLDNLTSDNDNNLEEKKELTIEERLRNLAITFATNTSNSSRHKNLSPRQKTRSNSLDMNSTDSKSIVNNSEYYVSILMHTVIYEMDIICNRYRFALREKIESGDLFLFYGNINRAIESYCEVINLLTSKMKNITEKIEPNKNSPALLSTDVSLTSTVINYNESSENVVLPLNNSDKKIDCAIANNLILNPLKYDLNDQDMMSKIVKVVNSSCTISNDWLYIIYSTLRKLLICCRIANSKECYIYLSLQLINPKYLEYHKISNFLLDDIVEYMKKEMPLIINSGNSVSVQSENSQETTDSRSKGDLTLDLKTEGYFDISLNYSSQYFNKKVYQYSFIDECLPIVLVECVAGSRDECFVDLIINSKLTGSINISKVKIFYRLFDKEIENLPRSQLECVEYFWDNFLSLKPGMQVIQIPFQMKIIGDFSLHQISLHLSNNISFSYYSPMISLDNYIYEGRFTSKKEVIRVSIPSSFLSSLCRVFTPSFSPFNQNDYIIVVINTKTYDSLKNMSVEIVQNNSNMFISKNSDWVVSEDMHVNSSNCLELLSLKSNNKLFIESIDSNKTVYIVVPFVVSETKSNRSNQNIQTHFAYELRRNQCDILVSNVINTNVLTTGKFLIGKLNSFLSLSKPNCFYSQYIIHNISLIDIFITKIKLEENNLLEYSVSECENYSNNEYKISLKSNSVCYFNVMFNFKPNLEIKDLSNELNKLSELDIKLQISYKRSYDSNVNNTCVNSYYQSIEFIDRFDILSLPENIEFDFVVVMQTVEVKDCPGNLNYFNGNITLLCNNIITITYKLDVTKYCQCVTSEKEYVTLFITSLGNENLQPIGVTTTTYHVNQSEIFILKFTYLVLESSMLSTLPIEIEYSNSTNQFIYSEIVYPLFICNGITVIPDYYKISQSVYFKST